MSRWSRTSSRYPTLKWGQTELVLWNHPGDDLFGAIARCARIVSAMELLLGGEVYHYHSKLIAKQPRTGGGFHWHQDFGYWYENGILFPDLASVMIAVDPHDRGERLPAGPEGLTPYGPRYPCRCRRPEERRPRAGRGSQEGPGARSLRDGAGAIACSRIATRCTPPPPTSPTSTGRRCSAATTAARNNPFRAHHHASYTPLETLPDEAVRERGHLLQGAQRTYMTPDSVKTHEIRGKTG